ncbi:hypothetical protein A3A03_03680 [Candidatus Nomurabacteria bacterium RIFCSPLOWO2_01_FULL_40_18]|uniref:Uncharacterized protein n=1 Tax=Candidatus Nomurabacteria bacterium RIFCSPLOWO2_01_FULL_40_18 TaxID=1801773 RepID=A0A1F6XIA1_9BACT|nr:MAG: hypothetical protein A3A03_03680 [Candidatus Nomurabacteria bacterium RIFCSPLOWO2_01_FULL_40_18]
MIIAIISILVLTIFVWIINKKLSLQICSICAGVTLTWLWMLSGMWLGLISVLKYEFLTAILMGASIGGIVTELKKIFSKFRNEDKTKVKEIESLEDKLKNCC